MTRSRRFAVLAVRNINKETFVEPWAEAGLMVTDSPYDPAASLRVENGQVIEMDRRGRSEFDALDLFIATHALNLDVAEEAMATPARRSKRPQPFMKKLSMACGLKSRPSPTEPRRKGRPSITRP